MQSTYYKFREQRNLILKGSTSYGACFIQNKDRRSHENINRK